MVAYYSGSQHGSVRGPSTAATPVGGRHDVGARVAREGWGRMVVGAPPNSPTLAAWRPWGLDVCVGPTTRGPQRRRVPDATSRVPARPGVSSIQLSTV
jgi:hypothetical protein